MTAYRDAITSLVSAIKAGSKDRAALARVRDLCDDYDDLGLDPGTCDVRVAIEGTQRNSGAVTTRRSTP